MKKISENINSLGKMQIGVASLLLFLYPFVGLYLLIFKGQPPEFWYEHMVVMMYVGAFSLLPKQLLGVYKLWREIKNNGQNSLENEEIGFKIQKDE